MSPPNPKPPYSAAPVVPCAAVKETAWGPSICNSCYCAGWGFDEVNLIGAVSTCAYGRFCSRDFCTDQRTRLGLIFRNLAHRHYHRGQWTFKAQVTNRTVRLRRNEKARVLNSASLELSTKPKLNTSAMPIVCSTCASISRAVTNPPGGPVSQRGSTPKLRISIGILGSADLGVVNQSTWFQPSGPLIMHSEALNSADCLLTDSAKTVIIDEIIAETVLDAAHTVGSKQQCRSLQKAVHSGCLGCPFAVLTFPLALDDI